MLITQCENNAKCPVFIMEQEIKTNKAFGMTCKVEQMPLQLQGI